jgi:hypothetical protein
VTQRKQLDDDDRLFDEIRRHVMENYPNSDRKGCLDHEDLRLLVMDPSKVDASDPRFVHLFRCSECTKGIISLREERDRRGRRRRLYLYLVAAAVLLIVAVIAFISS